MVDELDAVKAIHASQKKWRRNFQVVFTILIIVSSIIFIVIPQALPGMVMQIIMLLAMGSVFGFFFLDRISHMLNKKYFKQEIVHKYLFQHLKPDDVHKDAELVVDLISKRRGAAKEMRQI